MYKKLIFGLLLISSNVFAWDGVTTGVISSISVAPNDQRTFRVKLKDSPKLCGNNNDWAYIHESEVGFNSVVSTLLAAKFSKTNVTIYSNKNTQDHDYCTIGFLTVE